MQRESIISKDECPTCGCKIMHEYGSTVVCSSCGEVKGEDINIIDKIERDVKYGTF